MMQGDGMSRRGLLIILSSPSGAGKSTFVKLLQRLHDVDDGRILVDGQNISELTQESLRSAISLVPQDPVLFHRSLAENIAYGRPDADREAIEAAARQAHAHEFITRLEAGYETLVGERGVKLSGGERQRVAIARAIVADLRDQGRYGSRLTIRVNEICECRCTSPASAFTHQIVGTAIQYNPVK